ncbi:hypothetical protein [Bradyrhizobium sp. CCGUVB23]|uniref:hypothetical protein n=1 Tax=Bradyrhizobium sp. CCGUVB23 TaxID=2949630 RepID=UPI0020B2C085|nr:hypothetical protein [Bradyrhizobium sp. CCGUVB23]MCP3459638.1 hypothetical protein [Bradyrhizobium sp. CCGUVB23]
MTDRWDCGHRGGGGPPIFVIAIEPGIFTVEGHTAVMHCPIITTKMNDVDHQVTRRRRGAHRCYSVKGATNSFPGIGATEANRPIGQLE